MSPVRRFRPTLLALALALSPWLAAPTRAGHGAPAGGACCENAAPCEQPCVATKLCLHAEVTPHTYTVQVPVVPPPYIATTKEVERDQVCTRMVPVTCTDPCTGCTHTEYKPETFVQKVKTTVIDVCPNPPPCTVKTETRTTYCVNVCIQDVPAPAPACPPSCP